LHWLNVITNGVLCDAVADFAKTAPYFQHVIHLGCTKRQRYAHTVACTGGCGSRRVVPLVLKLHGDSIIYIISFTVIRKVKPSLASCFQLANVQHYCVISGLLHGVNEVFGVLGC
jgi:hypothetical protein